MSVTHRSRGWSWPGCLWWSSWSACCRSPGLTWGGTSFASAIFPLVCRLGLMCAALLVRQFRDSGDARAIVLASAYVFTLVVLAGTARHFLCGGRGRRPGRLAVDGTVVVGGMAHRVPGVAGGRHQPMAGPVEQIDLRIDLPSNDVGDDPCRVGCRDPGGAAAAKGRGWLPVVIDGLDTSALTRVTGPLSCPSLRARHWWPHLVPCDCPGRCGGRRSRLPQRSATWC